MNTVTTRIADHGLIPVVVLDDSADAPPLADALRAGGLPCAEVTFRTAAAADAIRIMAEDPDLLLGAGTVLTVEQVDQAVSAGAQFIVTPGFSARIVAACRERGVPVLPGVATATEIQMALDERLDIVKLFPAEAVGGVTTLKALSAPYPGLRFMPTGGVSAANLSDYLRLPQVIAAGGSWMVASDLIKNRRFDEVTRLTREAVGVVATLRHSDRIDTF